MTPFDDPLLCALIRHHADQAPASLVHLLFDQAELATREQRKGQAIVGARVKAEDDEGDEDDEPIAVTTRPDLPPAPPTHRPGLDPLRHLFALVAYEHGLSVNDLLSRSKTDRLTSARQEFFYRAAAETDRSYPQIGNVAHRDHTTVMHGICCHAGKHGLPVPRGLNMRRWMNRQQESTARFKEKMRARQGGQNESQAICAA